MGAFISRDPVDVDLPDLAEHNFQRAELRKLWRRFAQLSKNKRYIDQASLLTIPELQLNPLSERIAQLFMDAKGRVSFTSFVENLSHFHERAPVEEKLEFIFRVYDVDASGTLTVPNLTAVLRTILPGDVGEDALRQIATHTIESLDANKDGVVDLAEFKRCFAVTPEDAPAFAIKL